VGQRTRLASQRRPADRRRNDLRQTWENEATSRIRPTSTLETLAAKYDTDKDGRLTPEELKSVFRNGFRDYDLNKTESWIAANGTLTSATGMRRTSSSQSKPEGRGDLTSKVLWQHRKSLPNTASPLLYEVRSSWEGRRNRHKPRSENRPGSEARPHPRATEQFWASPVGADGKVYMLSQSCKLAVLSAKPQWTC